MNPLVTVYIVNYNYGNYLLEAYYSVLFQSYTNIELIIIDNNSKDRSKEILNNIEPNNDVKVIYRSESNLVSACNIALEKCSGEYLVRLDADDFLRKDAIEKLVGEFVNNDIDLVYPEYFEISAKGNIINKVTHLSFEEDVELPSSPAHGACTMFRVSALKKIGGYDEEFDRQDGYYIWLKFIINKFKIKNINEPLFFYRIHNVSLSHDRSNLFKTRSKISNKILNQTNIKKPIIDCVVPLLKHQFDENDFHKIIEELLESGVFRYIFIWASFNINIKFELPKNEELIFLNRKYEAELGDQILGPAIYEALNNYYHDNSPDYLFLRDLNTPFIKEHYFRQMQFMVSVFKNIDCIIGAVETKEKYYRFSGQSLESVQEDDYVENERERLYKKVRGVTLIRYLQLEKTMNLVSGIIAPLAISNIDAIDKSDFYYNFLDNDKNSL